MLLLGTANPDKIELEKALHQMDGRFLVPGRGGRSYGRKERGWGSDPPEGVATGQSSEPAPDARRRLREPRAARSGGAAARSRYREAEASDGGIGSGGGQGSTRCLRALVTSKTTASFTTPFLDRRAVSESGKPSLEAWRFIDETTGPDRPRANRNAVVLAVPSRDGLDAARTRIREHLGWQEVRDQLKAQPIDPIRDQMLTNETETASRHVPEAVRQAYSIVVTVNEANDTQSFKVAVTEESLFTIIKADRRARIQETAISSEAMMPGGPYDLWGEGESSCRVKDLGRRLRAVPEAAQDAAPQGDTEYSSARRPLGNSGGAGSTPGPDYQDVLAYRH